MDRSTLVAWLLERGGPAPPWFATALEHLEAFRTERCT